jgi:hypothetical protein
MLLRRSMPSRRVEQVWRTLGDICVLAEFFCLGFGVALLTEPRLHWTHAMGSAALDRMARSGQVWWGLYAMAVVALSLLWPRWFGLVAAISLAAVRAYDFWHDDPRNWYFLAGQAVFVALAVRGTYRRAVKYGG